MYLIFLLLLGGLLFENQIGVLFETLVPASIDADRRKLSSFEKTQKKKNLRMNTVFNESNIPPVCLGFANDFKTSCSSYYNVCGLSDTQTILGCMDSGDAQLMSDYAWAVQKKPDLCGNCIY